MNFCLSKIIPPTLLSTTHSKRKKPLPQTPLKKKHYSPQNPLGKKYYSTQTP